MEKVEIDLGQVLVEIGTELRSLSTKTARIEAKIEGLETGTEKLATKESIQRLEDKIEGVSKNLDERVRAMESLVRRIVIGLVGVILAGVVKMLWFMG